MDNITIHCTGRGNTTGIWIPVHKMYSSYQYLLYYTLRTVYSTVCVPCSFIKGMFSSCFLININGFIQQPLLAPSPPPPPLPGGGEGWHPRQNFIIAGAIRSIFKNLLLMRILAGSGSELIAEKWIRQSVNNTGTYIVNFLSALYIGLCGIRVQARVRAILKPDPDYFNCDPQH